MTCTPEPLAQEKETSKEEKVKEKLDQTQQVEGL